MDSNPPTSDAANHRDRSIRLAVITSLISKFGTIILRLVSIPVAIRVLGMDQFGVYTAITMAVGLIDMLQIGIGPALTRELSQAVARSDRNRERTIFGTSILISTGVILIFSVVAAVLLFKVPIPVLFGAKFESLSEVMYRAAWIGFAIILVEMLCSTFEMARDGYMETRFTNAWGAAGNLISAATLLIGIHFFPTIEFLIIAVNGPIALSKLCNTIHLLIQRPYLFPKFSLFRFKLVPSLAKDGACFSVTYILSAAIEYNVMAFLIGRLIGPDAVGAYNIMITIHFSLSNVVGMVTRPYWPALMDAVERKDYPWVIKSSKRLLGVGLGFGALTGLGLVTIGVYVIPLWIGDQILTLPENFQLTRTVLAAFSVYFLLHLWRHTNQVLVLGIGKINQVVITIIAEALTIAGLGFLTLKHFESLTSIYLIISLCILLFTGWMLPRFFLSGIRDSRSPSTAPETEGAEAAPGISH